MIDQDNGPKFPNGPIEKQSFPLVDVKILPIWATLALTFVMWFLIFYSFGNKAHADGPSLQIFRHEVAGELECYIDADLRVSGDKPAVCVEKLATAALLAKHEMRVNAHARKARR